MEYSKYYRFGIYVTDNNILGLFSISIMLSCYWKKHKVGQKKQKIRDNSVLLFWY